MAEPVAEEFSPRAYSGNISQCLIHGHSKGPDPGIVAELMDERRFVWDSEPVLTNLMHGVSDGEIDAIVAAFERDQSLNDALAELIKIDKDASGGITDADGIVLPSKAREKEMHAPLKKIFDFIAHAKVKGQSQHPEPLRLFRDETGCLILHDPTAESYPEIRPDFTVVPTHIIGVKPDDRYVTNSEVFVELKPSYKQGPQAVSTGQKPKPILEQMARYHRLFISARHFQLFYYGLAIFGTRFCWSYCDRGGLAFSPFLDLNSPVGLRYLIATVRSVTCYLTPSALGFDPSVERLSVKELERQYALAGPTPLPTSCDEHFYLIPNACEDPGISSDALATTGDPLFFGRSLFGRGTQVWLVRTVTIRRKIDGVMHTVPLTSMRVLQSGDRICFGEEQYVLKSSWRREGRNSESDVYYVIKRLEVLRGIAQHIRGHDVYFPSTGPNDHPKRLTITELRIKMLHKHTEYAAQRGRQSNNSGDIDVAFQQNSTLHRLLLGTRGRSLWEYSNERELLEALYRIVSTLKSLAEYPKGPITHRDISPFNLMLPDPSKKGDVNTGQGFIIDFEFAYIPNALATTIVKQTATRTHINYQPIGHGVLFTGTYQFAAVEVLDAVRESINGPAKGYQHTPEHDLESVCWVLAYVVLYRVRNCLREEKKRGSKQAADDLKSIMTFFEMHYGQLTLDQVAGSRALAGPFNWPKHLLKIQARYIKTPLADLIAGVQRVLVEKFLRSSDSYNDNTSKEVMDEGEERYNKILTHELLLGMIQKSINKCPA